ncbi:MAG TPA: tRNA uridine-5-carboxymethylaminomethyl(34) synthesis GTPase MnmE [Candidatus Limnocylindrales bacterium]|nr:tRNA uridine-5-carboxymethylaminomethyl(34) synthesis GTPase MnmE [Candidatus Limnocylindrales bacterium]
MYRADTIVACATPPGRGAIAIVRLSGPDCRTIADRIFRPTRAGSWRGWQMRHGTIVAERPIDEALAVFFPAPRTYTGEDMLELQCHGSPLVVEQVLQAAMTCGARAAEGGEFSRRAVLNGRMDLLQAEAVADLIDARISAGARAAWEQLQGALSRRMMEIRSRIVAVLADVEAHVDFSDDELPDENWPNRRAAVAEIAADIDALLAGFDAARRHREGLRVVVTGRPNAGKSSLINRLLGSQRMIVTDEAGTTRDVVEETVDLGGLALVLTDTAGLRDSSSIAENEAVSRARRAVDEADIVLYVVDASRPVAPQDLAWLSQLAGRPHLLVQNKSDLPAMAGRGAVCDGVTAVATSALTGQGCEELAERLKHLTAQLLEAQPTCISRVRHRTALADVRASLNAACAAMERETAAEIAALELRTALHALASLTEPTDNEEVLDVIFAEFCIGK